MYYCLLLLPMHFACCTVVHQLVKETIGYARSVVGA